MKLIYLSLGSNLGKREQHLEEAIKLIQSRIGMAEHISQVYESEPWGYASDHSFCNCCLSVPTSIEPLQLLDQLLGIEKELGRDRGASGAESGSGKRYSDRIIDIDLLFYGDVVLTHPRLTVPHPELEKRKFVLVPMAEIAPEFIHPLSGKPIRQLLVECDDRTGITPF